MSTALTQFPPNASLHPDVESQCSVAVIYNDTPSRERAIWLCHHLVREFWAEIDFKFTWWRFKYFAEMEIAEAAAEAAVESDMIVVSARAAEAMPQEIKGWFESWVFSRQKRDAALVVLTDSQSEADVSYSPTATFLREIAHRAGMECLLPLRHSAPFLARDQVRHLHDRANQVTEVLDQILHRFGPPPNLPSHWGINE